MSKSAPTDVTLPVQRIPIEVQGTAIWTVLHAAAYNFPDKPTEQEQSAARELVTFCLPHLLGPLCACKEHLQQYLSMYPLDVSTRSGFFVWTVDFHNSVNSRLGSQPKMSYDDAIRMYHQLAQSQSLKLIALPKNSKLVYAVLGDEYYSLVKGSVCTLGVLFATYVMYRIWKSIHTTEE